MNGLDHTTTSERVINFLIELINLWLGVSCLAKINVFVFRCMVSPSTEIDF